MPMNLKDFENKVINKIREKFDVRERKTHHKFFEIYYKNKKICMTYCSYGAKGKDIPDSILAKIKRQLRLEKLEQLYKLKECPMKADDYLNLLKQKNVISD